MTYDPERHHRRSIRLPAFDYAANATYFVTLCTVGRQCLFGRSDDGFMTLNEIGSLVEREWLRSATIRAELELHSFFVMPNHLHGLLAITPWEGAPSSGRMAFAQPPTWARRRNWQASS